MSIPTWCVSPITDSVEIKIIILETGIIEYGTETKHVLAGHFKCYGFIWYAGLMFDTFDLNKLKKYSQEKGRQLKKNIKPRENVESKKKFSQENVVQEKILPREMYMLEEKKR